MVNRVSSYFPKGGHPATETETCSMEHFFAVSENHISESSQIQQKFDLNVIFLEKSV